MKCIQSGHWPIIINTNMTLETCETKTDNDKYEKTSTTKTRRTQYQLIGKDAEKLS